MGGAGARVKRSGYRAALRTTSDNSAAVNVALAAGNAASAAVNVAAPATGKVAAALNSAFGGLTIPQVRKLFASALPCSVALDGRTRPAASVQLATGETVILLLGTGIAAPGAVSPAKCPCGKEFDHNGKLRERAEATPDWDTPIRCKSCRVARAARRASLRVGSASPAPPAAPADAVVEETPAEDDADAEWAPDEGEADAKAPAEAPAEDDAHAEDADAEGAPAESAERRWGRDISGPWTEHEFLVHFGDGSEWASCGPGQLVPSAAPAAVAVVYMPARRAEASVLVTAPDEGEEPGEDEEAPADEDKEPGEDEGAPPAEWEHEGARQPGDAYGRSLCGPEYAAYLLAVINHQPPAGTRSKKKRGKKPKK